MTRHLLLEGRSGIGKSTLLQEALGNFPGRIGGFCVRREIRDGKTLGFSVETYLTGTADKMPVLFMESVDNRPRCYYDVFAREAVQALEQRGMPDIILLDEFGGGELLYPAFYQALLSALRGQIPCIGVWKGEPNHRALCRAMPSPGRYMRAYREFSRFLYHEKQVEVVELTGDTRFEVRNLVDQFLRYAFALKKPNGKELA